MSDDLAAVLTKAPCTHDGMFGGPCATSGGTKHPECVLDALIAAGYAVVRLPEGVVVAHGTPLVWVGASGEGRYVIGPTP